MEVRRATRELLVTKAHRDFRACRVPKELAHKESRVHRVFKGCKGLKASKGLLAHKAMLVLTARRVRKG